MLSRSRKIPIRISLKSTHNWLQPATLLKLTLLHGCFSRFLNCTNATKLRNAPLKFDKYIDKCNIKQTECSITIN